MSLDPHDIYYACGIAGMLCSALAFIWRQGKTSGRIETKLDSIHDNVVEIKTNHLPHMDSRIASIEEYLRK